MGTSIVLFFTFLAAAQAPVGDKRCTPETVTVCSEDQLLFLLSLAGLNQFPYMHRQNAQAEAGLRIGTQKLLTTFRTSRDDLQREALVRILSDRQEKEIAATFAALLSNRVDAVSCWMAAYLAHRGDRRALHILNDHYWEWPVSGPEWNTVVYVFGEQHYYEASDNLIELLNAASGNLSNAALEALLRMYPGSKVAGIETIAGMQAYFRTLASSHR